MNKQIDSINALVTAFESRNEQLHEEIRKNEILIEEMKSELKNIEENSINDVSDKQ
jgi:predicted RNase H-like nuclease (RuvC/YqgF family)